MEIQTMVRFWFFLNHLLGPFKYYVSMFLTFFRPTHLISRRPHFLIPTLNMTSVFPHTHPPIHIFFSLINKAKFGKNAHKKVHTT